MNKNADLGLSPDLPDAANGAGDGIASTVAAAWSAANTPTSSQPLLGIFSGKPMPNWSVPPQIFSTDDRISPDDGELYQR